jgi:hypothetical protein
MNNHYDPLVPAKVGTQSNRVRPAILLDSGLRGNEREKL